MIKSMIYNFIWDIAQARSFKKGLHIPGEYSGKKGFYFQNSFNKTVWFHPSDNSYAWICPDKKDIPKIFTY